MPVSSQGSESTYATLAGIFGEEIADFERDARVPDI
jgi:hypothetical protein